MNKIGDDDEMKVTVPAGEYGKPNPHLVELRDESGKLYATYRRYDAKNWEQLRAGEWEYWGEYEELEAMYQQLMGPE